MKGYTNYGGLGTLSNPGHPVDQCEASCSTQATASKDYPRFDGIQQRINRTLNDAEYTASRAQAAYRAQEIINAHPEFAELLDLIQQF